MLTTLTNDRRSATTTINDCGGGYYHAREIELFEWQGRLKAEIMASEPGAWAAWKADPRAFRAAGGEAPVLDLWARARGNWAALRGDDHCGGDDVREEEGRPQECARAAAAASAAVRRPTLVVAHGALNRCMLLAALGLGADAFADPSGRFGFGNCDVVEVEWPAGAAVATRWRRRYRGGGDAATAGDDAASAWESAAEAAAAVAEEAAEARSAEEAAKVLPPEPSR